jgi:hypothetical protein
MAIVVAFDTLTAALVSLTLDYISLVPGLIPTRPAPQTPDQVLRECQYYFERSYAPNVATGTITLADSVSAVQSCTGDNGVLSGTTCNMFQQSFGGNFKQTKINAPSLVLWSTKTLNTSSRITANLTYHTTGLGGANHNASGDVNYASFWSVATQGTQSFNYFPTTSAISNTPFTDTAGVAAIDSASGWITFHYVADARLGTY